MSAGRDDVREVHHSSDLGLDERRDAWNRALFDWYFGSHMAGRPVYLSFDEAAALAIAEANGWDSSDPVGDLSTCLRPTLDRAQPFSYWMWAAEKWKANGSTAPPPYLHVLALTVLPATIRKLAGSTGGYYPPLFRVLGIEDRPERRENYQENVPRLWVALAKWLEANGGRHGLPTARAGTHAFAYLGWSRSQALIRSADRVAFIDFFEQVRYRPGDDPPRQLLLARFERWATRVSVSSRIRDALSDQERRSALSDVLAHDLATWVGESRDEDFRQILRLVPRLNASRRSLTTALLCPRGFRGLVEGDEVVAMPGDDRSLFQRHITLEPSTRRETLTVAGQRLQFRHRLVHVFEEDQILGGYTAVDRVTAGRSAWFAVAASVRDALAYLTARGGTATEWPSLPGWTIVRDVRLDASEADQAPSSLVDVMPPLGLRASLEGGLHLGDRHYLTGAAPDLVIPASPVAITVRLNGQSISQVAIDQPASIGLAPLAESPGDYVLDVGDQRLRFAVEPPGRAEHADQVLHHVLLRDPPTLLGLDSLDRVLAGEVGLSGAAIGDEDSNPADEPSWSPPTDGWLAISPTGAATYLPPAPDWMTRIGQGACHLARSDLEATVGHPVAWVVRIMRTKAHVRFVNGLSGVEERVEPVPMLGARAMLVPADQVSAWQEHIACHGPPSDREPLPSLPPWDALPPERTGSLQFDRALHWCSERTEGTVADFVDAYRWLHRGADAPAAYLALRTLSRLGDLEVDWHNRRWSTTPTRIVVPQGAGGLAFMVGRRPASLIDELKGLIDRLDLEIVVTTATHPTDGPTIPLVRAGSRAELLELALAAGIPCVIDAATRLAALLPTLDCMVRTGRIPTGFERRKILVTAAGYTTKPAYDDQWHGSYEHDSYGPTIYSFRDDAHDDRTYLLDRSTALWHELRRQHLCPIDYHATQRTLHVPRSLGLPLLHERALILATGFLPSLTRVGGVPHLTYQNIPPHLAARVKETLS